MADSFKIANHSEPLSEGYSNTEIPSFARADSCSFKIIKHLFKNFF